METCINDAARAAQLGSMCLPPCHDTACVRLCPTPCHILGDQPCSFLQTVISSSTLFLLWASFSHLCASVTKQYNLVPVKGRLPCDWGVQTLWSVCGWQIKLCDPLVTHGPCLTSRSCPAWQLVVFDVVESYDLTDIKRRLLLLHEFACCVNVYMMSVHTSST